MFITPEILCKIREVLGLSQADIAALCDVSDSYVTLIEKRRRPMPERVKRKLIEELTLTQEKIDFYLRLYDEIHSLRGAKAL